MATWKKVAVSGSNVSQFNNDSGYLTSVTAQQAFTTASFNGTELLADSSQGNLTFASGSGQGLTIGANAGTDTLTFGLSAVPNASLANDSVTVGTTEINLGASSTTLAGLTSVTSTGFTGSLSATSTLADGVTATTQTSGDNSTKVATTAYVDAVATAADLDLAGDGSTTTAVDLDSQTLTFTGNDGLQLSASAQTITATIADGGIANAKLANSTISGKSLGTNLDALTAGTGVDLDSGTTYDGSGAKTINLDLTEVIDSDSANRVLTSDGDGTLTAEPNFTFDGTDLTVTGNQLVTGNLTVQGTASFQHNEELQIADRFILMASGSTTAGDGGIVVQQDTQNVGELFAFDSGTTRWALDSAFDASNTAFTPEAFMATVVEGADADPDNAPARYDKKGNIFVGTDEGIWIYS